jgi:hypothetical protein
MLGGLLWATKTELKRYLFKIQRLDVLKCKACVCINSNNPELHSYFFNEVPAALYERYSVFLIFAVFLFKIV